MLKFKRRLKKLAQYVFALVALVLLILSLPLVAILAITHYCKRWIGEVELKPAREMSPIEQGRLPLEK